MDYSYDATLYRGRPLLRRLCVRRRPSSPPSQKKEAHPPIFRPCLSWRNGWMDQVANAIGTEVGLGPAPGNIVLDGDPSPHKRGTAPNFRPMSVVATWHRGRPHPRRPCVSRGPSSIQKMHSSPIFDPCLLLPMPKGYKMHQDITWYGGRPRSKRHCVRWGPSSPKRRTTPNFRPMSIVAKKRLDESRCH